MPWEQEKTYSVQLLCTWIIIDNEQVIVLMPDCLTAYSLQLLYKNFK
jgi:hypothetical protein